MRTHTKRRWTDDEDRQLRASAEPAGRVGVALGHNAQAVKTRRWRLGLTKPGWSSLELDQLRAWYEERRGRPLGLPTIAARLGRTEDSVAIKAGRLGFTDQRRPKLEQEQRKVRARKFETAEARHAAIGERMRRYFREHDHPSGALGHKHSEETRRRLSERLLAAWANPMARFHTPGHRQGLSDRLLRRVVAGEMRRGGYSRTASGRRADLDNRYFRSRWEANYCRFLELLRQRGDVVSWAYEPHTFVFEKISRGTRAYTPDFKVTYPDGRHEWHEVKGWMDQPSRTRLARMARYYPGETVVVIGADWFRRARRSGLAGIIPGWERDGRK